ncbi:hypothetical protein [Halorubrum tropicale]|uniref:hypothetical protein n=1 Tax=Halorubrum tropicale TaxID=1765655 RepID=UPI0006B2123E|nr:hypothetical protein [Halorubrum tropicale]
MTDDDLPALDVGDHVVDRDNEDEPRRLLVVGLSPVPADNYEVDGGRTVADANPDYPADDDVIRVIFPKGSGLDVDGHQRYAYPRSRLRRVAAVQDAPAVDLGAVSGAANGGGGR